MSRLVVLLILALGLPVGCSKPAQPAGGVAASRDPERAVRAVIAEVFKIEPSAIDMNRPLFEAPLNADELDLVELVMEIEERLEVVITDDQLERMTGGKFGKTPVRLTPAQLVRLAAQAEPSQKPK